MSNVYYCFGKPALTAASALQQGGRDIQWMIDGGEALPIGTKGKDRVQRCEIPTYAPIIMSTAKKSRWPRDQQIYHLDRSTI
jgi:hypothetical protein